MGSDAEGPCVSQKEGKCYEDARPTCLKPTKTQESQREIKFCLFSCRLFVSRHVNADFQLGPALNASHRWDTLFADPKDAFRRNRPHSARAGRLSPPLWPQERWPRGDSSGQTGSQKIL